MVKLNLSFCLQWVVKITFSKNLENYHNQAGFTTVYLFWEFFFFFFFWNFDACRGYFIITETNRTDINKYGAKDKENMTCGCYRHGPCTFWRFNIFEPRSWGKEAFFQIMQAMLQGWYLSTGWLRVYVRVEVWYRPPLEDDLMTPNTLNAPKHEFYHQNSSETICSKGSAAGKIRW